ncbi:sex-determining region Y protein-like [Macrobrachium nipponense]|uniref:sex-determining region Y protein-like n=1 Tax=Macrobrachium nipponense TaxID=159736 RepID=UPI0030C814E1
MDNRIGDAVNMEAVLLHVFRATAKSAAEKPDNLAIIMDCCMAIEKGLQGWKVYQLRGQHLMDEGLDSTSVQDFEMVYRLLPSEKTRQNLNNAKEKQAKWEKLSQTDKKADILRAFRNLSMLYHPERHRDMPEILQEAFQELFKGCRQSKTVRTDEEKQRSCDRNHRHEMNSNADPMPIAQQQRSKHPQFHREQQLERLLSEQQQERIHHEQQQLERLHWEQQQTQERLHRVQQQLEQVHREQQLLERLHREQQQLERLHREQQQLERLHREQQQLERLHREQQHLERLHREQQQLERLHREQQHLEGLYRERLYLEEQQRFHGEKRQQQQPRFHLHFFQNLFKYCFFSLKDLY